MVSVAWSVWTDYGAVIREAESRNIVLAQLLEEHAKRSFDISRAALLDLTEEIVVDGALAVTPQLKERSNRWVQDLPGISSFWYIDEHGKVLYVTSDVQTEGYNFSDRAYFKAHANGEEFFVSPMTLGRVDGKWFFSLSRRISDKDGAFRGVLVASTRTDYFFSSYGKLTLAPLDNIGIFKMDGATVVRHLQNWVGDVAPSNAQSTLFTVHLPNSPRGVYKSTSPIDGVTRLLAYRVVDGWPLVVVTGAELSGVLAPWRDRTINSVLFCFVVVLMLAGVAAWGYRRARSEALALSKNAVLLTEVHHRVKNNLAIVQSLLMLEANRAPADARGGYEDSIARIEAMGLVHHLIYDHQTFEGIQAGDYLRQLCAGIQRSAGGVRIQVDAEAIDVPLDNAVPMALIASEVITNAVKHAFPGMEGGHVWVKLRSDGEEACLTIQDNGVGLPAQPSDKTSPGIGMLIVRQLTRQLNGSFTMESDQGVRFTLRFPRTAPGYAA